MGAALRGLRRRPWHGALVVLTLGLGIGASLAVFSVVDAILLRPLPFSDAARLVSVSQSIPAPNFPELNLPGITLRRMQETARGLDGIAGYQQRDVNLVRADGTERLIAIQVTEGFLGVLGVQPALGRAFLPDEEQPAGPRAVLISDGLWRRTFNADPAVVGRVVDLEGEPFTIVGVMPAWFVLPSRDVSVWEPLRMPRAVIDPGQNRLTVIARLRQGVERASVERELTQIIRQVGREYPGPHPGSALDPAGYHANVAPLADAAVGDVKPVVLLLLTGVVLLLVLTCANVVNLQLASAIQRGGEIAVRAALGASRTRLVGSALVEGLMLATAGATVGATAAVGGARLLVRLLPAGVSVHGPLADMRSVVITAIGVLIIGAVIGAAPTFLFAGRDPARRLQGRGVAAAPRVANRLRASLAVAQVALAVLLLHNAALLIASARQVQQVALGFRTDSTISLRINLPAPMLSDRTRRELVLRRVIGDVRALPGIEAAGLVNALPLELGRRDQAMAVEGRPFLADGSDPVADYRVVSHGYFDAMSIPLVKGQLFSDDDATATNTPLVVNESLERLLFPDGEDPIGKRLRFGPVSPWMPIVGVVRDAKNRSVTEPPRPEFYVPGLGTYSFLAFRTEISIVARARGDAMTLVDPIRRVVRGAAPDIATYNISTLGDIVREARARMITATRLMSAYAVVALVLAIAGTYALLAYLVGQRRQELAIRLALGATAHDVARLVGRESARLVGLGALLGLLGAVVSSRLISALLFGVGTLDPVVVLVVLVLTAAAAVLAALVPARRASRVDPGLALRAQG